MTSTSQTLHDQLVESLRHFLADRCRAAGRHPVAVCFLNRCAWWQRFLGADPLRFRTYLSRPGRLVQDREARQRGYDQVAGEFSAAVTNSSTHTASGFPDGSAVLVVKGELLGTPADFIGTVQAARSVRLEIDSPGGHVSRALLDALEAHPDTQAVIRHAGSAGAMLAIACRHRGIEQGGSMLLHSPIGAVLGDSAELRKAADRLEEERRLDEQFLARRTRLSRRRCRQIMSGGDHYFTPEEAVNCGLVHEIDPDPK